MTVALRKKLKGGKNEKLKYKKDRRAPTDFEVEMVEGTLCDLNNEPRFKRVCYAHAKHEIYSLKETLTCNYEFVVLTPNPCLHPKYEILQLHSG